jgi:dipeptidyl aminopeptidase/acylaminoacyl peptidase
MKNKNSGIRISELFSIFTIILLLFNSAQGASFNSLPSSFSNSKYLIRQNDCFTKDKAEYETWISNVSVKDRLDIMKHISKERFEHYKNNLECYEFIYKVSDIYVKGYLVKPKVKIYFKKHPVIIFNRGGNDIRQHTLKFSSLFQYHMYLAAHGYIVISSQYRGADVWPEAVSFDTGRDEFGGKDLADVLGLYPLIDGMADADKNRIGMFGWSRGGMMTYLALKESSRIKAAAVGGAPTDLIEQIKYRPEMEQFVFNRLIPSYHENRKKELENRSVIYWPEKLNMRTPILMIHGGADKQVRVSDSIRLAEKLKKIKHPHKLLIVPNASHGISEDRNKIITEVTDWFDKNL